MSHVVRERRASEPPAPAVLALDAAGRLLHRSASAAAMLCVLDDAREATSPDRPNENGRLPAVVAGTLTDRQNGRRCTVRGRDGRAYVLQIVPAVPRDAGDHGAPSVYVVIAAASDTSEALSDDDGDETSALAERYGLSPREHEMLRHVARGDASKAIAAALGLSVHTVQEYVGRACRKVGVRTRRELVARLLEPAHRA